MTVTRRQLLGRSALAGAGLIAATSGLEVATAAPASARTRGSRAIAQDPRRLFPPLEAAPGALLALPRGFSYVVTAEAGVTDITDGTDRVIGKTPDRPDGTGAFDYRGAVRLVQNHELRPGAELPVPLVTQTIYDLGAEGGGCTVIETDREGRRRTEWVGISGTYGNCAGGVTPWVSWLTCEETEAKAGTGTLQKDHGYVFEVLPDMPWTQTPLPIRAWGRFAHEAAVIDGRSGRAYLTEDSGSPNGLFYRWTPPRGYRGGPGFARGLQGNQGRLEAMVVLTGDGSVLPDLAYATSAQIGRPWRTRWVDVPDRQATDTSVRKQFDDGQVTRSHKLEGAWGDDSGIYFAASFATEGDELPADATKHDGQIWYYDYRSETLTLVAYFPFNPLLRDEGRKPEEDLGLSLDLAFDGPDNVHVTPYGDLILAEDGEGAQHLISWSAETGAQAVARNLIAGDVTDQGVSTYSEMTGPTFNSRGDVLFGNVQEPGHTFAIRGPWRRYLG